MKKPFIKKRNWPGPEGVSEAGQAETQAKISAEILRRSRWVGQWSAGFTIVEVLVTSLVFSIMMVAVSSIFIQIINDERRAFAAQAIQENGQFILEMMSREIRVSKIENQESLNCAATTLTIIHPVNGTVIYALTAGGVLQRTAGGVTSDLSASTVTFSRLNFCIYGSGLVDGRQPRVAILASMQNKAGREILTFNLQTTVTSRDIQSEFEQ